MKNRIRSCTGKVEFNAHREKIYKLLEAGNSIIMVYEILQKEHNITQAYTTFVTQLRKDKQSKEKKDKELLEQQSKPNPNHKFGQSENKFFLTEKSHAEKF